MKYYFIHHIGYLLRGGKCEVVQKMSYPLKIPLKCILRQPTQLLGQKSQPQTPTIPCSISMGVTVETPTAIVLYGDSQRGVIGV